MNAGQGKITALTLRLYCSHRGYKFGSQHEYTAVHKLPVTPALEIQRPLLAFWGALHTSIQTYTQIHTLMHVIKFLNKKGRIHVLGPPLDSTHPAPSSILSTLA